MILNQHNFGARRSVVGLLLFSSLAITGCNRNSPSSDAVENKSEPTAQKEDQPVMVPSGVIPRPSANSSKIPFMGGIITSQVIAGKIYIPIEGTFTEGSFKDISVAATAEGFGASERRQVFANELAKTIKSLKSAVKLIHVKEHAEVGFFSALIDIDDYQNLSLVKDISRNILINPIIEEVRDPSVAQLPSATGSTLGILSSDDDARSSTASYSGLERIGVKAFLKQIKAELGEDIDGSRVNVGVTDTGITFNHPSFFDKSGQSRITYMKDFTGEGLIYFPENAEFAARAATSEEVPSGANADEVVVVTAKFISTPVGRAVPVADKLSDVTNQVFQMPKVLKDAILTPNSGARLGVLSEAAYANAIDGEFVDINRNGKNDDLMFAILLPSSEPAASRVFIDFTGRGDFRSASALGDFNATKTTTSVFAEKVGLELKSIKLAKADQTEVNAIAAAIVGFDPGNHGSHVAGIIGGRKTIANDQEGTFARGVAPNTKIMMDRVCANNGGCTASEAIVDLATAGAEVINMSLGGLNPWNDGYGVQETIVNRLSQKYGTVFVISAGNSGPGRQTVGSPSVAQSALSVAATATKKMVERQYQYPGSGKTKDSNQSEEDFLLFFSSRGPTAAGGFKPNISAPGTELSAVQLNSPAGQRSGLDVYWGTSMAAPTATGAVALLLDAAKLYNEKNPGSALLLDNASLRRAITSSARPFDVNSYSVKSKKSSRGQYTWIDQGHGMIDLPAAWKALKAERDLKLPSAVSVESNGTKTNIDLEYEVRVLRTNPNGNDYSGAVIAPTSGKATEPRFGRGIYLDMKSRDSLIGVQIARRLPLNASSRPDVGELHRQLVTTADTFVLETTMYGSKSQWIKTGTLGRLDCQDSSTAPLTVIGQGALDNFSAEAPTPPSTALAASTLNVCLNRGLMATLTPGDHGALIKAYRISGAKREAHPSFIVPVYLTVPHGVMSGSSGYNLSGVVKSFGVQRNYIDVPKGLNLVKITIEVPEAKVVGNAVSGCSGVELMILEGLNTAKPAELSPRAKARASNCDPTGATSDTRRISYTRFNPTPGVWDVHVFGQYAFAESAYTLTVEFANITSSVALIGPEMSRLNGSLNLTVGDASLAVKPSSEKSELVLSKLEQRRLVAIKDKEELKVVDSEGTLARVYDSSVGSVTISTGGLSGSDLDLKVLECSDAALEKCEDVAESAGPADDEKATFTPVVGKFYVPIVIGYSVSSANAEFKFTESKNLTSQEKGLVTVTQTDAQTFAIAHKFDVDASGLLKSVAFTSRKWIAGGQLSVNSDDGAGLLRIPVEVQAPEVSVASASENP
ncbi:MAG: S8 family serine peptidase [Proteobacteria bacterium]|nr:S8 family serine peptidase [Pseudomonadota bacterium]